jgi:hypothetical protein
MSDVTSTMRSDRHVIWHPLLEATAITLFILGLFYYWFGVADRYAIFLYGHTAAGIQTTQPFDAVTSNRYWMAGLVAAGTALALYTVVNWLGGRIAARRGTSFELRPGSACGCCAPARLLWESPPLR